MKLCRNFSLRTLLIGLALVAATLATIMQPVLQRQQELATLRALITTGELDMAGDSVVQRQPIEVVYDNSFFSFS